MLEVHREKEENMEATQERMKFILKARRTIKGEMERVPSQPENMPEVISGYPEVSEAAVRLNNIQKDIGFYVFYPEAYPENTMNTHCKICMQLAANDARDED